MNLKETYIKIIGEYETNNYTIQSFSNKKNLIKKEDFELYALNFLIYEYMNSKNDERWRQILNFVVVPNTIIIDFSNISFGDFFKFMLEIKNFN
jgi:hypothetical protein